MENLFNKFSIVFVLTFVFNIYHENIFVSGGPHEHESDIIVIGGGKGCSPGIIKQGGSKNILALPNCQKKKIPMKKVQFIPLPYPVKEYIPVIHEKPIFIEKKKMAMPIQTDMHMGMPMDIDPHMAMDMTMPMTPQMSSMDSYGMDYGEGMNMGMGFGMDTKKSEIFVKTNQKSNVKKIKRKVVNNSRNIRRNERKSEAKDETKQQMTSNRNKTTDSVPKRNTPNSK